MLRIAAVDTETWGNIKRVSVYDDSIRLSHLAYWSDKDRGKSFDIKHPNHERLITKFGEEVLANKRWIKLFWNARFDVPVLNKFGIEVKGPIFDVMIAAQMAMPDEPKHSLKHFAQKFLSVPYLELDLLARYCREHKCEIGDAPLRIVGPYNLLDAKSTYKLWSMLQQKLYTLGMWDMFLHEMKVLKCVLRMERVGVKIDIDRLKKISADTTRERDQLRSEIASMVGRPDFNPNSPKQVAEVIYVEGVEARRFSYRTGSPSTDSVALLQIGSDLARAINKFRVLKLAASTYGTGLLSKVEKDGILHAQFNQGNAVTGRFSSSKPNLQNIPRSGQGALGSIRTCFTPRVCGNRLVFIDYDQIEARLTAHFSGERHMLDAINNGLDLHGEVNKLLFSKTEEDSDWEWWRYIAKKLNFAVIYGIGPAKFCDVVLKETDGKIQIPVQQAYTYIERWKTAHPAVMGLFDTIGSEIAMTGGITNFYGRFVPVDQSFAYTGVNYLIQGTAADFMKRAMVNVQRHLRTKKRKTEMILTVHDELVFEMPASEKFLIPEIVDIMEDHESFLVPLTCSVAIGKDWGNKKKIAKRKLECLRMQ